MEVRMTFERSEVQANNFNPAITSKHSDGNVRYAYMQVHRTHSCKSIGSKKVPNIFNKACGHVAITKNPRKKLYENFAPTCAQGCCR